MTRVAGLALYLDRIDPSGVFEIDLTDDTPSLEQLLLGWLDADHIETVEALALTVAGRRCSAVAGEGLARDGRTAARRGPGGTRGKGVAVVTSVEAIKRPTDGEPGLVPLSHLPNPDDPTLRKALCGEEFAGIPAFGQHEVCSLCLFLQAAGDPA